MINRIIIKDFKCHKNLDVEFFSKDCIIYGENGSGKSSIYWALYSLFKVYFRNKQFDFNKFESGDNLEVRINVNGKTLKIPNDNYDLPIGLNLSDANSIYFLNQDTLNNIIYDNNSFYNTLLVNFKKYFYSFAEIDDRYKAINQDLRVANPDLEDLIRKKNILDAQFQDYVNKIKDEANLILLELEEGLEVTFNIAFKDIDTSKIDLFIDNPMVILNLNNKNDLKLYFNESKIKLISFSIYFAMINIERERTPSTNLKVLVFDDFLTSLDMANREYIFSYIYRYFEDFQKIIFTHNLQFYNLMINWLKFNSSSDLKWDLKNIYLRKYEGNLESILYVNNSYYEEALKKFKANELPSCGNLIRKEFERIIHELGKIENIGAKEETDSIVQLLANKEIGYFNQKKTIETIFTNIIHCKNLTGDYIVNKTKIIDTLNSMSYERQERSEHLYSILKRALYFRKILMNKSSHYEPEAEIYRSEYDNSLKILNRLNQLLSEIQR